MIILINYFEKRLPFVSHVAGIFTSQMPQPLAKHLFFMSGFAFGGRLWVNVTNGRHHLIAGICPD
jgi:hypothetical protein